MREVCVPLGRGTGVRLLLYLWILESWHQPPIMEEKDWTVCDKMVSNLSSLV